jgi:general secretion pathway protein K
MSKRMSRASQRGAALLTAMVIVTLIVTLAASMVWQQWRAVQIETAERSRNQAAWILSGALDWARLILREDARTGGATHLGEPWAVPLAEARLSTFLAVDKENTDDAPEAFLSGMITDAQSRYNLHNLVDETGKIVPFELQTLQRLCDVTGVAAGTAEAIAETLQRTEAAFKTGEADAPLMPQSLRQFAWAGIDEALLRRLQPYVVLLPRRTPVNLNTAPREVLAAVVGNLDLGSAERMTQSRQSNPFMKVEDAQVLLPHDAVLDANRVAVSSSFFEVRGRLRLGERVLEERSLIERRGLDMVVLDRERVGATDTGG